ncbi:MAG: DUF2207 domain-containing protein, partial [Rhodospirillales bacterium]|nr:DUF2207 domain-containing protein [Rhodospirillales bacterium]
TAPDGNLRFVTTRTLGRGEGLTVAIGWPKGFVVEPGSAEKAATAIRDNLTLVAAVIGLLLVIAYYLWAWDRVGRDPKAGTIVPLFGPPEGFSPAATRTLVRMGTDDKAFAAAVVSMAVKGYLKIDEKSGGFAVQRVSDDDSMLSPGEKALARKLCPSRAWVEISVTNHKRISDTKKALEAKLKQELHKIYFNTNRRYLIPGAALTVLTIVAVALASADTATVFIVGFLAVWLSVWTSAVLGFIMASVHGWRTALSGRLKDVSAAIVVTAFAVGFLAGEVMGVFFLAEATSPAAAAILLATALMIPLFYGLLKAPTLKGRRILDEIEGFKMYLSTAEKERLETLRPPEDTPELFEKYLPYALALGVENQWSERFADVLAATEPAEGGGYHPGWYSGRAWSGQGVGNFGNTLGGSLSSALASSAAGPVSSGSGGGGSGGGGGGGGGGGF